MFKTKNQLVKYLKEKCAYEGDGSLDNVKKFCADNDIVIAGDLDALFTKKVTIAVSCDAGEEVEVGGDTMPTAEEPIEGASCDKPKSLKKALGKMNAKAGPSIRTGDNGYKSYNLKIANGKAKYDCPEKAEYHTALTRLIVAKNAGKDYEFKTQDEEIVGKSMNELTNAAGGALMPTVLSSDLIYMTEPYGIVKLATQVDMTGGQYNFARKTSVASWSHTAFGTALTAADNAYDNVTLTPKQIGTILKVHNRLFRQAAINVADDVAKSLEEGFYNRCDNDFINGDGTATYGGQVGLANALRAGAYQNAAGNAWSAVTAANFRTIQGSVANVDPANLCWIMSRQAFYATALRLADAAAGTTASEMLQAKFINNNMGMIGGDPVYFSSQCPIASASGSKFAFYGDFKNGCKFGIDSNGFNVLSSDIAGFAYDETWTRGSAVVAINCHDDGKSGTVGAIACLQTT